jgi:hypothetical protein
MMMKKNKSKNTKKEGRVNVVREKEYGDKKNAKQNSDVSKSVKPDKNRNKEIANEKKRARRKKKSMK